MEHRCTSLDNCGYFDKYQNSKETTCKGWIRIYCQGPKMDECKRREYKEKHGKAAPDDMMPSGLMSPEYLKEKRLKINN